MNNNISASAGVGSLVPSNPAVNRKQDTYSSKKFLNLFDKNKNGTISTKDLKSLCADGKNFSMMDLYNLDHKLFPDDYAGLADMPNPDAAKKMTVSLDDLSKALDVNQDGKVNLKDFNQMAKSDGKSGISLADFSKITEKLQFKQQDGSTLA